MHIIIFVRMWCASALRHSQLSNQPIIFPLFIPTHIHIPVYTYISLQLHNKERGILLCSPFQNSFSRKHYVKPEKSVKGRKEKRQNEKNPFPAHPSASFLPFLPSHNFVSQGKIPKVLLPCQSRGSVVINHTRFLSLLTGQCSVFCRIKEPVQSI